MTGANIVVNPSFATGLTGWTQVPGAGSIVWSAGGVTLTGGAGATTLQQNILPVSKLVRVRVLVTQRSVGSLIRLGGPTGPQIISITKTGVSEFLATTGTDTTLAIRQNGAGITRAEYITVQVEDQSMSKVVLTLRDYDGDKKQTSVELGPVTDGASYVTREGQAVAIRDAVNAVAGNIAGYDFLAQSTEPNNTNAVSPVFQTHVRWIVELFDSVTGDGPYEFDIPTADLGTAGLFLPASVEHDPAHAAWIALKASLNGIVINPRTGSTMTVGRIYLEE